MEITDILQVLPHRYPFLLVDRVLEVEAGRRAVGLKNVSANEPYFQGHFPGRPVMPGVLVVEALAQVGAVALLSLPQYRGRVPFFAGIDRARFRHPVLPGDQLLLEVELLKIRGGVGRSRGVARVAGEVACEAELMFALAGETPSREG